jgi:hypothetical protein
MPYALLQHWHAMCVAQIADEEQVDAQVVCLLHQKQQV